MREGAACLLRPPTASSVLLLRRQARPVEHTEEPTLVPRQTAAVPANARRTNFAATPASAPNRVSVNATFGCAVKTAINLVRRFSQN